MDNNIAISIVIPVYNAEDTLRVALDDIRNQSFTDFEIICIDDSSDDKSLDILNNFSMDDDRILIVPNESNRGAAWCRNTGLKIARGKYIIFLDSDDRFDRFLLEKLYKKIVTEEADISICEYKEFYQYGDEIIYANDESRIDYGIMNIGENASSWGERALVYTPNAPWARLYNKNFVKTNKLLFQNLKSCNDVYFTCTSDLLANKTVFVNEKLISYRKNNPGKISENRDSRNIVLAMKKVWEKVSSKSDLVKTQIVLFLLNSYMIEVGLDQEEKRRKESYIMLQSFLKSIGKIKIDDMLYSEYYYRMMNMNYDSKWFEKGRFYFQFISRWDEIYSEIKDEENVYVWGLGKRGKQFLECCYDMTFAIQGVTDSNKKEDIILGNDNAHFYDAEYVLKNADVIMASNTMICEYLEKKGYKKKYINLQKYSNE